MVMAFDGSRAQFYRAQVRRIWAIAEQCVNADMREQLERIAWHTRSWRAQSMPANG
jgi:hypothetical protein